jgi:sulfur-oxidizing protein SoxX
MRLSATLALTSLLATLSASPAWAADEPTGQSLAFDNKKGNCLACHSIPGDPKADTMANIAPPLIAMKSRYPDRTKLRDQIWDATKANPRSSMIPFGKHKVLTEQEIDKIVDYVHTL